MIRLAGLLSSNRLRAASCSGALLAVMACSTESEEAEQLAPPAPQARALVQLSAVPSGVRCLRVTVAGSWTTTITGSLGPGEMPSLTASGLPTGNVTFVADAFTGACESLSETSQPRWRSEPLEQTLQAGVVASLVLSLYLID